MALLKQTAKLVYGTIIVFSVIAGAIIALFSVLDVIGISQGQAAQVLRFPENLNELIGKGIQALDKYLGG